MVSGQASKFASQRLGFLIRSPERDDPALLAHALPINAWAQTVWDATVPAQDLQVAIQWAEQRRATSKSPWHRVVGPAGATVTSLSRLGWQIESATKWLTDQNDVVDLLAVCPKTVASL
eukprot:11058553-Karenia_brevis.AAC.1